MALELSRETRGKLDSGIFEPQLLVEIEGIDSLITSDQVAEILRFGAPEIRFGDEGLFFGGQVPIEGQEPLIDLSGTTTRLQQQLRQDEGGSSSTSNFMISLINKDNRFEQVARLNTSNDVLSRRVNVWLGVRGTRYPEDFVKIFVGNITEISSPPGRVQVNVSYPEHLKRADLFLKVTTELTDEISDSATTLPVISTVPALLPTSDGLFKCFVRINDEVIEYEGLTDSSFTTCTRGAFGTTAVAHDEGDTVETIYVLGDDTAISNAIDLALKVLLSGQPEPWLRDLEVAQVLPPGAPSGFNNSVFIEGLRLREDRNLRSGDLVSITGSSEASNNVTDALVVDVLDTGTGTFVQIDPASVLVVEASSSGLLSAKSQWDVLPDGCGLSPDQVDLDEFFEVRTLFASSIPTYSFFLKDTITGSDLINREILFPAGAYSLPRKGRVSVGKVKPPIATDNVVILNESNVTNAGSLKITRSVLQNFFNATVFKYEQDILEDRFLRGDVTLSATSTARIKRQRTKPYLVESLGLRSTGATEVVVRNNSLRILDRYQFGAELIAGVRVQPSVGLAVEIGDSVVLEGLQLFDSKTGVRSLDPRVCEVINKQLSLLTGEITLDLLDTAYSTDGRFGVVSPSSLVESAMSEERVVLSRSFSTPALGSERQKWEDYIGLLVEVRAPDYSRRGQAVLVEFDPGNDNAMILAPGLGFVPEAGDIVDIAGYDTAGALYKSLHVYFNPQTVVSETSVNQLSFEVSDPSVFFVGSIVLVHSSDYSQTSTEAIVTDITGDVITVGTELGIVPEAGFEVELIGFASDEGLPYRIL